MLNVIDTLFPKFMGGSYDDIERPKQATAIGVDREVSNDGFGNYTEVSTVYFTNEGHDDEYGDIEYFDEHEDALEFGEAFAKSRRMLFVGDYENESYFEKPEEADRIVLDEDFDGNAVVYFGAKGGDQLTYIVKGESKLNKTQAAGFARRYADHYELPLFDLL